jgi:hypothetical protein
MMMMQAMLKTVGRPWGFSIMFFLLCIPSGKMLPALFRLVLRNHLKGGFIMAIVRHTAGKELSPKKQAAMKAEIEAASRRSYVYDPDSPLLTEKQLSEFKPVHCSTMEERAQVMQNQESAVHM